MSLLAMLQTQTQPAIPTWIWVAAAFLVGCYVGSHISVKTRVNLAVAHNQDARPLWSTQTIVRKMDLKCQCGAVHKFREGDPSSAPGLEAYPQGDSYTCSSCGRPIDLKQIRELADDAMSASKPA